MSGCLSAAVYDTIHVNGLDDTDCASAVYFVDASVWFDGLVYFIAAVADHASQCLLEYIC